MRTNFQRIATNWIVNNNPNGVRLALVTAGLISNVQTANSLSQKELATLVYNYYLTNGNSAFASFLRSIEPNYNIPYNEVIALRTATRELNTIVPSVVVGGSSNGISTLSTGDSSVDDIKKWWDLIIGTGETNVAPTVTTTTKSSPVTIALIIGAIAVLGIIAWVVIKLK